MFSHCAIENGLFDLQQCHDKKRHVHSYKIAMPMSVSRYILRFYIIALYVSHVTWKGYIMDLVEKDKANEQQICIAFDRIL